MYSPSFDTYIINMLMFTFQDSDIQTYKHMSRVDSLYHMCVELRVRFGDLHKCQTVSNLLVEKLDETVQVSVPEMFHANSSLESLRYFSFHSFFILAPW